MDALMNFPPDTDLMSLPMAINPNGDPPNFINPPSLKNTMLGLGVALIAISGPMLILRLIANWRHSKRLYMDDSKYIIPVYTENRTGTLRLIYYSMVRDWMALRNSILGNFVLDGCWRICRKARLGHTHWCGSCAHIYEGPLHTLHSLHGSDDMQRMFAQTVFGYFNMWMIRAAVLLLYIRIFNSVRWVRYTSWAIMVLSGMFYATTVFVSAAHCTPKPGKDWSTVSFSKCADPVQTM
jgi:hypothetical protein